MDSYAETLRTSTNPSIAYRAHRLLDDLDDVDGDQRRRRAEIARSSNVRRLLGHRRADGTIRLGNEYHAYRKFQGAHWTLAALAELGYPSGDQTLLPVVDQVLEWLTSASVVSSGGTFADWGPTGPNRPNPYVSLDATWVLTSAGVADV